MKLLLDSCVWGPSCQALEQAGHDVVWAGAWTPDPGDEEILARARDEGRVLITLDKDFGELAVVRGLPHWGIVRLAGFAAREQALVSAQILETYGRELEAGALITVDRQRVRIRPGPRSP